MARTVDPRREEANARLAVLNPVAGCGRGGQDRAARTRDGKGRAIFMARNIAGRTSFSDTDAGRTCHLFVSAAVNRGDDRASFILDGAC